MWPYLTVQTHSIGQARSLETPKVQSRLFHVLAAGTEKHPHGLMTQRTCYALSGRVMLHTPLASRCMAAPAQPLKSPMSCAAVAAGAHSRYTVAPPSRVNPKSS